MNNLKSYTEYAVTTPTTDFVIGFDFNYGTDAVNVTVAGVPAAEAGYSATYLNSNTIRLNPAVPSGVVRLQRETDIDVPDNQFTAGAKFIASNVDENFTQIRHAQQEVRDGFSKLRDDTSALIDGLDETIGLAQDAAQSAQDAADVAEQAAQVARDAAAQVSDKVSYQDLGNAISATPHNNLQDRDGVGAHPTVAIVTGFGRNQEDKNLERLSPFDYQAIGDGVTDDTTSFKQIEGEASAQQVDLAGATFAINSSWADSVNGVTLTKDYVNGTLIVDGRKLVFNKNENFSTSAASSARLGQASTLKAVGIKRVTNNEYHIWRPLGGQYWQQAILRRTASNVPLNWQDTYIKQVLGYICCDDGLTYSGTWATLDATTGLSSADPNTYVGGRARQATAAGDYVDIPYTGGGDIYVLFVGRTTGNYVNVLLDGGKDYLVLPADGSDNRYFDSYTSTDLRFKQLVKIASGVPNGNHTIRLTMSASKNPASTGGRFLFNALTFDNSEFGPWRSQADALTWKSGETVLLNQVRKHGANYYYASVAGTTGSTAPTHTSGAVSDGGVTWTYRALSGYDLLDTAIQVAGSQLEYAYEMKPDGATAFEDVGGALHGNETQTALKVSVNGSAVTMLDNTWLSGDFVNIVESQYSTHSQIGGGLTPIVESVVTRTFKRQWFELHHTHEIKNKVDLGYFYSHMWPLLHYHGVNGQKYVVESIWSSGDGHRYAKDYYSQLNPIVGRTKDTLQIAYGICLQPNGSGGVPTTQKAPLRFAAWLDVDPSSVDAYSNATSVFSGKAMNISGVDVSAGGYSSDVVKMYFERYAKNKPKTLDVGDTFECFARYGLDISQKV